MVTVKSIYIFYKLKHFIHEKLFIDISLILVYIHYYLHPSMRWSSLETCLIIQCISTWRRFSATLPIARPNNVSAAFLLAWLEQRAVESCQYSMSSEAVSLELRSSKYWLRMSDRHCTILQIATLTRSIREEIGFDPIFMKRVRSVKIG